MKEKIQDFFAILREFHNFQLGMLKTRADFGPALSVIYQNIVSQQHYLFHSR